jgi:hypothetical protein
MRHLVEEGTASVRVPPDYIAIPLLVTAGALIGNAAVVEIKRGWREGPNLSAAVVGPTGSGKSPGIALATRPIHRLQAVLARHFEEELKNYEADLEAWNAFKKGERPAKPEPPVFGHVLTSDATVEALAPMLRDSKGIVLLIDEMVGWVRRMDQYRAGGKGADRQHYLSMWSRTSIKVDRKSSPKPIIVPHPCLSVAGGIQPDLLSALADSAGREDGFLDRLLWSYPDEVPLGWSDAEVSIEAIQLVDGLFERLYRIRPPDWTGETDDDSEPLVIPSVSIRTCASIAAHASRSARSARFVRTVTCLRSGRSTFRSTRTSSNDSLLSGSPATTPRSPA